MMAAGRQTNSLNFPGTDARGFLMKGIGMLCLGRNVGEEIFIGDDIKITLLSVGPNRARIGIDAPKELYIRRAEIEKIEIERLIEQKDENREADL